MSETFFTSDPHFGHAKIIEYCNRPYASVEEMNEGLVAEFNKVVGPNDFTYFLGDMSWGPFDFNRLNGQKALILGNHDNRQQLSKYFDSIGVYSELRGFLPKGNILALMHYPIESWNRKFHGSVHLHGHTHGTGDNSGLLRFDMGVDCWNMKPVSFEEVRQLIPIRKEQAASIKEARDEGFKQLNVKADKDYLLTHMEYLRRIGSISSCTCMTKTPQVAFHSSSCKYRIVNETVDTILDHLGSIE